MKAKHKPLPSSVSAAAQSLKSTVRTLAVALGLSASAYMNPAMAQPFSCGEIYAITQPGEVLKLNIDDGSFTQEFAFPPQGDGKYNPFGLGADGILAIGSIQYDPYGIVPLGIVAVHNTQTNQLISVSPGFDADKQPPTNIRTGAVHPLTGLFYMATPESNDPEESENWVIYGYDPEQADVAPFQVGVITGVTGTNGDLAFDSVGNLYLLSGSSELPEPNTRIYRVGQLPAEVSLDPLPATAIAIVAGNVTVPGEPPPESGIALRNPVGIAFNDVGELVTSTQNGRLQWFNPLTGIQVRSKQLEGYTVVDLASCAVGNTVTLVKNLPNGRIADSDQFTLQLSGGGLTEAQTSTTTGTATGIQDQSVGPRLALDGATLTINEVGSGTTNLDNYLTSWQCVDVANNQNVVASGSTLPGSVTIPSSPGDAAAALVCTITNRLRPEVTYSKAAEPPTGIAVEAGDTLIYTLNVEVVNGPTLSPVELTDVLGQGLSFDRVVDPISPFTIGGDGIYILPEDTPTGNYSMQYRATVEQNATVSVGNSVTAQGGGDPTDPIPSEPTCKEEPCATEHPLTYEVVVSKSADPEPGALVQAGRVITYTIEVDVVGSATQNEVIITDVLGEGLEYVGTISLTPPLEEGPPGTFTLPAGEANGSYFITYTAIVTEDATLQVNNTVTPSSGGGGPAPTCLPGRCATVHPISPIVEVSKIASPEPGTAVIADQSLTYTLTVAVAKGPTLSDVILTDQLGDGLTYGAVVSLGAFEEIAPGIFKLPKGALPGQYPVSYTATVNTDATVSVSNSVIGTGGGNPDPNLPPSEIPCAAACETEHPIFPKILISKDADPDSGTAVEQGDTLKYTVTVEVLNGPTQSVVTLTDIWSSNVSFAEGSVELGVFQQGDQDNIYLLPAGTETGTYDLSYSVTVAEGASGTVTNSVSGVGGGTGNPGDPGFVEPTCISLGACATEHPLKFAVLVSKVADVPTGSKVKKDDILTYTLTVDVVFSPTQSEVTLTDTLDDGLTYLGVVDDNLGAFGGGTQVGNTVVFTLPAGTPNDEYSVSYQARVNEDATVTVNNSVVPTGGGAPGDPNYPGPQCDYDEDHSCTTEHPVEPSVLLSKTADPESGAYVKPGDQLTYTVIVQVVNGPTKSVVTLIDEMSEGLSPGQFVELSGFSYVADGGYLEIPAGTPSGSYPVIYTATVDADATVSVDNKVDGSGGGDPSEPNWNKPSCIEEKACETTHPIRPIAPLEVAPVPLGSVAWSALLVGLLALFAMFGMRGRRRTH